MSSKVVVFLLGSIVSGLFAFAGPVSTAGAWLAATAQLMFYVFLALLLISLVRGLLAQADGGPNDNQD